MINYAIFPSFTVRRDTVPVFARIVSHCVPWLLLTSFQFRSWRWNVRRTDVGRRFASTMPNGIPRLFLVWFGVLRRRKLDVVSVRIPKRFYSQYYLMSASRWLTSRRCLSVCQNRAVYLHESLVLVFHSESAPRQEASWCSASVCQRRALWFY